VTRGKNDYHRYYTTGIVEIAAFATSSTDSLF